MLARLYYYNIYSRAYYINEKSKSFFRFSHCAIYRLGIIYYNYFAEPHMKPYCSTRTLALGKHCFSALIPHTKDNRLWRLAISNFPGVMFGLLCFLINSSLGESVLWTLILSTRRFVYTFHWFNVLYSNNFLERITTEHINLS